MPVVIWKLLNLDLFNIDNMKTRIKIIFVFVFVFLFTGTAIALQNQKFDEIKPFAEQRSSLCKNTGTTTICLEDARITIPFDALYEEQGICFKIKDKSGNGYTYFSVEDGMPLFSILSCE